MSKYLTFHQRLLSLIILFSFLGLLTYGQKLGESGLRNLNGEMVKLSSTSKRLKAIVFLSPECPLSQNYTLTLNQIQSEWHTDLEVIGIFPGKSYNRDEYIAFRDKYQIQFLLLTDSSKKLVNQLKAKVTPEIFLINEDGAVLYSGAIDNWVIDLGKKRSRSTKHYLIDAITSIKQNKPIPTPHVNAIGCFIVDL